MTEKKFFLDPEFCRFCDVIGINKQAMSILTSMSVPDHMNTGVLLR